MSWLTNSARVQLWQERLNRQAVSALTIAEFCAREDVSVPSFYQWKRRLLAGETNCEPLLPWNWAPQHPESIRSYFQQERSDRQIRKRDKRAKRRANQKRQARLDRR